MSTIRAGKKGAPRRKRIRKRKLQLKLSPIYSGVKLSAIYRQWNSLRERRRIHWLFYVFELLDHNMILVHKYLK